MKGQYLQRGKATLSMKAKCVCVVATVLLADQSVHHNVCFLPQSCFLHPHTRSAVKQGLNISMNFFSCHKLNGAVGPACVCLAYLNSLQVVITRYVMDSVISSA